MQLYKMILIREYINRDGTSSRESYGAEYSTGNTDEEAKAKYIAKKKTYMNLENNFDGNGTEERFVVHSTHIGEVII